MRSDVVKKGVTKAPHRSLFKASGLTDEEINKPLIGVVTSQNDIIPGHINLDKIVEGVKWFSDCKGVFYAENIEDVPSLVQKAKAVDSFEIPDFSRYFEEMYKQLNT